MYATAVVAHARFLALPDSLLLTLTIQRLTAAVENDTTCELMLLHILIK